MQQNETIFFDGDQCSFNTVEGPLGGGGRDKEAQRNFKIAFIDCQACQNKSEGAIKDTSEKMTHIFLTLASTFVGVSFLHCLPGWGWGVVCWWNRLEMWYLGFATCSSILSITELP